MKMCLTNGATEEKRYSVKNMFLVSIVVTCVIAISILGVVLFHPAITTNALSDIGFTALGMPFILHFNFL